MESKVQASIKQKNETLGRLYYDRSQQGSLSGAEDLFSLARRQNLHYISLKDCKEFLSNEPAFALYRRARKKYQSNKTVAYFPGACLQSDILVLLDCREENNGYGYIFVMVSRKFVLVISNLSFILG